MAKLSLGSDVLLSLFTSDKIDEASIEHLKQQDILEDALKELSKKTSQH